MKIARPGKIGVDIICIEKEGIVEKLIPFTEGVGIALVNLRVLYLNMALCLQQKPNVQVLML